MPPSLSWPQSQIQGQLKTAWNPPQLPHRHRQRPPPSCPRPITQNISIKLCPAASEPTQPSPAAPSCEDSCFGSLWHFTRDIKPMVVFYVLWFVVMLGRLTVAHTPAGCNSYCAAFVAGVQLCAKKAHRWNFYDIGLLLTFTHNILVPRDSLDCLLHLNLFSNIRKLLIPNSKKSSIFNTSKSIKSFTLTLDF